MAGDRWHPQWACACSWRARAVGTGRGAPLGMRVDVSGRRETFPQMLEPPHLLHSTSGPVLAQGGALAFLASIVTRWCSHKLEHLYSLHLSRMCLYSPHLLHLISGPVLAQAGAPAFLASTPYALVLAQRVPPTRHAAAGATVQPSGKREGRFAKVVARSMPLAEHASLIIVCVLGPNRKLVVQLREACCMQ